MHYLLRYEIAADYLTRRAEFRAAHLALAWAAADRGELVLGGVLGDPPQASLLVFAGDSAAVAERFAAADPYVQHGLVTAWSVTEWLTVAGSAVTDPPFELGGK